MVKSLNPHNNTGVTNVSNYYDKEILDKINIIISLRQEVPNHFKNNESNIDYIDKYKSYFERYIAAKLTEFGIDFIYNNNNCIEFKLPEENNIQYVYSPDFILNKLIINGKIIIIEPHIEFNEGIIKKYSNFLKNYKNYFYFLIFTNSKNREFINYYFNSKNIKIANRVYYINRLDKREDENVNKIFNSLLGEAEIIPDYYKKIEDKILNDFFDFDNRNNKKFNHILDLEEEYNPLRKSKNKRL